jgi:hypothetical protein
MEEKTLHIVLGSMSIICAIAGILFMCGAMGKGENHEQHDDGRPK